MLFTNNSHYYLHSSCMCCSWLMKHVLWSITKNLFKQIFCSRLSSYLKFKRKKSVCAIFITVYHNTSKNSKLTFWWHPFQMNDIFNVFLKNIVHFVNQGSLFIFWFWNLICMWSQKMLDTIHLMIKIPTLKISSAGISFHGCKCSDSSTTGTWAFVLTISYNLTHNSLIVYSNMWRKK